MSAFLVNDKTINRILYGFVFENDEIFKRDIWEILKKIRYNMENVEDVIRLGEAIRKLNYRSLEERYGKITPEFPPEFEFSNSSKYKTSTEQVYYHLCCLTYQCCEGRCSKSRLYKALRELKNKYAHYIAFIRCRELNCEWEAKE